MVYFNIPSLQGGSYNKTLGLSRGYKGNIILRRKTALVVSKPSLRHFNSQRCNPSTALATISPPIWVVRRIFSRENWDWRNNRGVDSQTKSLVSSLALISHFPPPWKLYLSVYTLIILNCPSLSIELASYTLALAIKFIKLIKAMHKTKATGLG